MIQPKEAMKLLLLNIAPAIYCGLKPLNFKACFAILILTIVVLYLRVKITPTAL